MFYKNVELKYPLHLVKAVNFRSHWRTPARIDPTTLDKSAISRKPPRTQQFHRRRQASKHIRQPMRIPRKFRKCVPANCTASVLTRRTHLPRIWICHRGGHARTFHVTRISLCVRVCSVCCHKIFAILWLRSKLITFCAWDYGYRGGSFGRNKVKCDNKAWRCARAVWQLSLLLLSVRYDEPVVVELGNSWYGPWFL